MNNNNFAKFLLAGIALVMFFALMSCSEGLLGSMDDLRKRAEEENSGGIIRYTVTFNLNGSIDEPPPAQTVNAGGMCILPPGNIYTRNPGEFFGGWNTRDDGQGNNFAAGYEYPVNGDMELFANWVTTLLTITYDISSGEGTAPPDSEEAYGTKIMLPNTSGTGFSFSKEGHAFNGWDFNGSGTIYNAGEDCTIEDDVTFYATWVPVNYTVIYNKNTEDTNLTGSTANSTHVYNVDKNLTTNGYKRPNFKFTGWNTEPDGTGDSYTDGKSVKNLMNTSGTFNLYAQWKQIAYVYLPGSYQNPLAGYRDQACYFVDGEMVQPKHPLAALNTRARAITVSNGTVYVGGLVNVGEADSGACY